MKPRSKQLGIHGSRETIFAKSREKGRKEKRPASPAKGVKQEGGKRTLAQKASRAKGTMSNQNQIEPARHSPLPRVCWGAQEYKRALEEAKALNAELVEGLKKVKNEAECGQTERARQVIVQLIAKAEAAKGKAQ